MSERAGDQTQDRTAATPQLVAAVQGWLSSHRLIVAGLILAISGGLAYPVMAAVSHPKAGVSWRPAGLQGITTHFLIFGKRNPSIAYAATEKGVYRLTRRIWSRVLPAPAVWSVGLSTDDRTVVAGDETGDVYVSRNAGKTWRHNLVSRRGVYAVSVDPNNRDRLLAGAGGGLYLSRDGGTHWRRELPLPQSGGTAFAWKSKSRVVFAGVVASGTKGSTSVYLSRDAGLTWRVFGSQLRDGSGIMSLIATDSKTVFAGTMGHAIWAAKMAGGPWQRTSGGMPAANDHVAGIAEAGLELYVGTLGYGVFHSTDEGARWAGLSSGLPASANANIVLSLAYSANRHEIFAGTADGVYRLSLKPTPKKGGIHP